jgi:hypothetical protein
MKIGRYPDAEARVRLIPGERGVPGPDACELGVSIR